MGSIINEFIINENRRDNRNILLCHKNKLLIAERNFIANSCKICNNFLKDIL